MGDIIFYLVHLVTIIFNKQFLRIFFLKLFLLFVEINIFNNNFMTLTSLRNEKCSFLSGTIFHWYKNMNSTFAVISALVKGNMGEKCLINFLMNMLTKALRHYLECANIYKGTSPKKKTDLIEMVIYGCIIEKVDKKEIEDISIKQANQILNKNNITVKSLPGYGNSRLRKREIKSLLKEKPLINI